MVHLLIWVELMVCYISIGKIDSCNKVTKTVTFMIFLNSLISLLDNQKIITLLPSRLRKALNDLVRVGFGSLLCMLEYPDMMPAVLR